MCVFNLLIQFVWPKTWQHTTLQSKQTGMLKHSCICWLQAWLLMLFAGFGLAIWIGFSLFAAIGLGNLGQAQGGEDMY